MSAQMKPETIVLHAGPRSDSSTGAVAVPIFQTTSYQFRSTEHAANLFALRDFGNIYSRIMNPTCDALEQKMAALEGGIAALAVSSGQAASAMALQNLCRPGDNVSASRRSTNPTPAITARSLIPMEDSVLANRFQVPPYRSVELTTLSPGRHRFWSAMADAA